MLHVDVAARGPGVDPDQASSPDRQRTVDVTGAGA